METDSNCQSGVQTPTGGRILASLPLAQVQPSPPPLRRRACLGQSAATKEKTELHEACPRSRVLVFIAIRPRRFEARVQSIVLVRN